MVEIKRLKVPPAYQAVSEELQRMILDGSLKPGQQLPGEFELAQHFGVNRSTVREGIRRLESDGLIRRESRKRRVIAIPEHTDISSRTEHALLMNGVRFIELWEVALALEPAAASLTARNASEDQIRVLTANVESMARLVDSSLTDVLDCEFHGLVAEFSANRALLISREPIGQLLIRPFVALRRSVPQAAARNLEAHRQVLAAIVDGDAERAELWMRRHIVDFRRGWVMSGRDVHDPVL